MKKYFISIMIVFCLLLSPYFSSAVHSQTGNTNKIVTINGDTVYSGTYVYQGMHQSSNCGTPQTRPYYKSGTHFLYADYWGTCTFPNGFEWVIFDGDINTNSPIGTSPTLPQYIGWDNSDMNYPQSGGTWWWGDFGGNDKTSLFTITDEVSGVAPTVSTINASLVTNTSGTLEGNIIADGGATTSRGFVYSSSDATPTIGEAGVTQITKGTGTGLISDVISSLTAGGTYYFQAYGTNTYGTTYGGVKSFTTPTTSQPNKYLSGVTTPAAANGVYVWIGNYYGKPAWKHQTSNYWIYYSIYSPVAPFDTQYGWYIDDELKNNHSAEDFLFDHVDAATCPSSGWRLPDNSATSISVVDYPQVDFTGGTGFSPASPTGGTNNNPIGRFFLDADTAGAALTAVTINAAGTRSGISNLKLWSSTDATFNAGSDTLLNSQSDGSTVTFSGFSSSISASGTYYFVTTDLGISATGTFTLTIGSKANLTISGGASSTVFSNAALSSAQVTITQAIEINIKGNGVSIGDGDTTPASSDHTDFGSADIAASSVVRTFTIENLGSGTLLLTDPSPYVVISGDTTDFSLTQTPSNSIAGSSSTTFQVTFNPTTTGTRSAAISIANNDGDENPYNFSIQGTGTSAPEMDISGNATSITDGDLTPAATDDTDFGSVNVTSGSVEHTFTITNAGSAALSLTGASPYVTISGNTSDFSLTQTPSSSIAAGGGTTTFRVTFNPTTTGTRSATISIANNDGDENPYNFSIQGTGITAPNVTTSAATALLVNGATLGGNVSSDGGVAVTERGVVYSATNPTPTIGGTGVTQDANGSGTGTFSEAIAGMTIATHYYYQAYAINTQGTSYGGVLEFTTRNSVTAITLSGSSPTNASSVSWEVEFGASVTGLTSSNFTLANTGLTGPAITAVSDNGGSTWTVTASTGTGSGTLGLNLTSDAGLNAGLSNIPYTGAVYTLDRAAPTVTINQAVGQSDPTDSSPINFTVVFSEAVSGFATGDVDLSSSTAPVTLAAAVSGGPTTYNVAVSGMTGDGLVIAAIAAGSAQDTAGNVNIASTSTDNRVRYDTVSPSVTINQAVGQADPTHAAAMHFTVVFSEAVTGFAAGDVTLGGPLGGLSQTVTEIAPMNGTTYDVSVTGMSGSGTVTATIASGVASDLGSHLNTASASTDNTVTYDDIAPNTSLNSNPTNPTASTGASFTFSGTDTGTGVARFECDLDGGGFSACPSPKDYTALADGSHTFRVRAIDNAGNTDPTPASFTWVVDATAPDTSLLSNPVNPTNSITGTFTFNGNDGAGVGGLTFECKLDGGSFAACPSPKSYNTLADGSHTFQVSAVDALGNVDPTPVSYTWTVDTAAPTVQVSSTIPSPTKVSPIPVTITFSESVTGFTPSAASGDIIITNGTGSNPAGSGTTYTFDLTPSGQGPVTVVVPAGSATDAASNGNVVSNTFSITYDTVSPTVTVEQASGQADPTNVIPINFKVIFSEAITGFAPSDVTLAGTAGATTAIVTETAPNNGTTYNVAVSGLTGAGTVTVSLEAGQVSDLAGNENTASTTSDATVTFAPAATTTVLTWIEHPWPCGQSWTLNAAVSASTGTPTGTVTFRDGTTVLGTSTLSSGTAAWTVPSFPGGWHSITAEYNGSGSYVGSVSDPSQIQALHYMILPLIFK